MQTLNLAQSLNQVALLARERAEEASGDDRAFWRLADACHRLRGAMTRDHPSMSRPSSLVLLRVKDEVTLARMERLRGTLAAAPYPFDEAWAARVADDVESLLDYV